jgi:hypothetical protein
MLSIRRSRSSASERGQSVVEFALILPLLLIIFLAVSDFARLYAEMLTVESAAREAADFGALNSANWEGDPSDPTSNYAKTLVRMGERACIAARNLPDYVDPDDDPSTGCDQPDIDVELTEADGSSPTSTCADDTRLVPCRVVVTLSHDFHLIAPMNINFFGVNLGFPSTITFERTSIFAVSDFELFPPE